MPDTTDWGAVAREDLRHLKERDRPDERSAGLPKPGERHSASSIPVSDTVLSALLAQARIAEVLLACPVEDCENCNSHRLIWWDCCSALDRSVRIALQSWLVAEGFGLPDAPWEDIDAVGNTVQRNWTIPRP